ncbi:MAG TPA: UDP-glucose/GDP-mannose dehydrogenase family protein [Stenomitos sp.]
MSSNPKKLAIVGTGYVGLVTGTCFAEMGHEVTCVDVDRLKVLKLTNGELTIFEPGLELLFERNTREGRLTFTTDLQSAVEASDIIFLALPTPPGKDGAADLSAVLQVADQIGGMLNGYKIIVNKSTVPVGTADRVRTLIMGSGAVPGEDFDVVSNPEFLREGVAVDDFMKPERVVIGSSSERAAALMRELYEPFVRSGNPILVMDERSSEMTKYAANAFLATKITFMNEIANLCEKVGANVDSVRLGTGTDGRIGKQFLYAGIGFGGSCFPKDVKALASTARANGYRFRILDSVLSVNEQQQTTLVPRLMEYFGGSLEKRRIAVWGLSFKANTDDVRESSAFATIQALKAAGAKVTAFDPAAMGVTRRLLNDEISYAPDAYEALWGADALVICTEWNEFRRPNFDLVKERLKFPAIFDGRNLYDPKQMASLGFDYVSIGRPQYPAVPQASLSANGQIETVHG